MGVVSSKDLGQEERLPNLETGCFPYDLETGCFPCARKNSLFPGRLLETGNRPTGCSGALGRRYFPRCASASQSFPITAWKTGKNSRFLCFPHSHPATHNPPTHNPRRTAHMQHNPRPTAHMQQSHTPTVTDVSDIGPRFRARAALARPCCLFTPRTTCTRRYP